MLSWIKQKSSPVVIILFTTGLITGVVSGILVNHFIKSKEEINIPLPPEKNLITTNSPQTDQSLSILLLGFGGPSHDGGSLTDSLILVNINPKEKSIKVISIPRDLWVAIPTDYDNPTKQKINAAYSIGLDNIMYPNKKEEFKGITGGGNLAMYAVSEVTSYTPQYFISVDFSGFTSSIDLLGGIDINVAKTFEDKFYPIKGEENNTCGFSEEEINAFKQKYTDFNLEKQFTCRYETLHFEKGMQQMNGETALKFVRSRHSETYGNDFARSERQHAVLEAIKEKVLSTQILNSASPIFKKLTASVKTNIEIENLQEILKPLGDLSQYTITHLYLTDQNVLKASKGPGEQFILIPKAGEDNWTEVQKYLQNTSQ